MEVILGKSAGFCYGVRRAVEGAKEELKKSKGKTIFCLGEIVHNKQVVDNLKNQGMEFIENIKEAKEKAIIRAHGVEKNVYKLAKKMKINIKDFTCPNVLKIHNNSTTYQISLYLCTYIPNTGADLDLTA